MTQELGQVTQELGQVTQEVGQVTQELGLRAECSGQADAALCSHIPVAGYHPPDGQELFEEGVIPAWLQPVE